MSSFAVTFKSNFEVLRIPKLCKTVVMHVHVYTFEITNLQMNVSGMPRPDPWAYLDE